MENGRVIIEQMLAAAPSGLACLDSATVRRLSRLTTELMAARPEAATEHERFNEVRRRGLRLPADELAGRLGGATVLVTGGTGCIGSALLGELSRYGPGRLVSVSRGTTAGWPSYERVEYRHADIRDRRAIGRLFGEIKPDIVFHVAAQRDPGLAEIEVHHTVSANVFGARNVFEAAAEAGAAQVTAASTGKALRPFSPDVYTASKRAAEWIGSTVAAGSSMICSAGRFTHVVDNSIIYQRLVGWASGGDVIRLHGPSISFYVQSALESAQLLMIAMLGGTAGAFRVLAITDLGWPVSLLDLTLGLLAELGSAAPVYFSGYDAGYEETPFPGLYDPATAGDVSPLLNSLEAAVACDLPYPMVDAFGFDVAADPVPAKLLTALEDVCRRTCDPAAVRAGLDELSWSLLDATLHAAPECALARIVTLMRPHQPCLSAQHRRIFEAIAGNVGIS